MVELDNIKTTIKNECDSEADTQMKNFDNKVKEYSIKFDEFLEFYKSNL